MSALALGSWELWKQLLQREMFRKQGESNWGVIARSCGYLLRIYSREGWISASLQCAANREGTWSTRKDKGNEVRIATAASFLSSLAKTSQEPGLLSNMLLLSSPFPQAQWRGDRRQRAHLEDAFMVLRIMGQDLFSGSLRKWSSSDRIHVARDEFSSAKSSTASFSILPILNSPQCKLYPKLCLDFVLLSAIWHVNN